VQIHWLKTFLIFPPAARGQRGQDGAHPTGMQLVCGGIYSVRTVQSAFRRKFNADLPTNKSILKWYSNFIERGYICDQRKGFMLTVGLGESCWSRQRILFAQPSNKRAGTSSVCNTTVNFMSLCNCSNQFCKNIPLSFDFITMWNEWVFLRPPCIYGQFNCTNEMNNIDQNIGQILSGLDKFWHSINKTWAWHEEDHV
jgi:hypothetical protein